MSENSNTFWNSAGRTGLILGCISILYFAIEQLLGKIGAGAMIALLINLLIIILWAGKFAAIIATLSSAIKKRKAELESPTTGQLFRFGMACSLLAALIYSGFTLFYYSYISPDTIAAALEASREMFQSGAIAGATTSQIEDSLNKLQGNFPTIMFWSNLFYCLIWGAILSSVTASRAVNSNPFENQEDEEDDD